ncbi:MAG: glucosaminidase domain-containing protein [Bacteroidales bacterium]|nr:glucosaminidase domain-containing protein [Bacteroidales bacterium]
MEDRNRLEKIRSSFQENGSVTETDQIWIFKLAKLYKVKTSEDQVTDSIMEELWKKVDIIPGSLALAQGAEESGWGTSRFAASGNAIYGQWSWGENAMTPEKQRKELGNYGIASFGSLQESVSAYMINLNTHNAYSSLRDKRAELRKNGEKLNGSVLAEKLDKYSERGMEYVNGLKSMMEYNKLSPVDDAYLSKEAAIYLFPSAAE